MNDIEKSIAYFKSCIVVTADENDSEIIKKITIQALEEKLERKNPQPLTLEELKQMDGQPVWIVKNGEGGKWFIFDVGVWSKILYAGDKFNLDFYGETWLAYRYPPKELSDD